MEEADNDDDDESVDFEKQLKKDISSMVNAKLDMVESRVNYLIGEHEKGCHCKFEDYKVEFKN